MTSTQTCTPAIKTDSMISERASSQMLIQLLLQLNQVMIMTISTRTLFKGPRLILSKSRTRFGLLMLNLANKDKLRLSQLQDQLNQIYCPLLNSITKQQTALRVSRLNTIKSLLLANRNTSKATITHQSTRWRCS